MSSRSRTKPAPEPEPAPEPAEVAEEAPETPPPSSGRTFETDREGVYSATEGGTPDPTVQPGGGTVSDPIPGAGGNPA